MPVKRKRIESICEYCGETFSTRSDDYKRKYILEKRKKLCPQCVMLNPDGFIDAKGYVVKHWRTFPKETWGILRQMCKPNNQIKEHRAIMAIHLGRPLKENEIVHHKNGNKTDNQINNLELISAGEHTILHMTELAKANRDLEAENIRLKEEIQCLYKRLGLVEK